MRTEELEVPIKSDSVAAIPEHVRLLADNHAVGVIVISLEGEILFNNVGALRQLSSFFNSSLSGAQVVSAVHYEGGATQTLCPPWDIMEFTEVRDRWAIQIVTEEGESAFASCGIELFEGELVCWIASVSENLPTSELQSFTRSVYTDTGIIQSKEWRWSLIGKRMTVPQEFQRLVGAGTDAHHSQIPIYEFVHPEDRELLKTHIDECRQSGVRAEVDVRVGAWYVGVGGVDEVRDPLERWFRMSMLPLSTRNDGRGGDLIGSLRDVTVEKYLEGKYIDSQTRLTHALEAAGVVLFDYDIASGKVQFSETWRGIVGENGEVTTSIDEWVARTHPDDIVGVKATLAEHFRGDSESVEMEFRLQSDNGEWRWITTRGQVVQRNKEGRATRMLGVHMDVTEKNQVIARWKESEERFRTLADSAVVLIWMMDTLGEMTFFNRAWLNFTGRESEEELGAGWIKGIHSADIAATEQAYREAVEHRKPFRTEFRVQTAPDSYRWVASIGAPRFSEDGAFHGFVGTCIDIHQNRELIEQRNRSMRMLEIVSSMQADFIARLPMDVVFQDVLHHIQASTVCEGGYVLEVVGSADTARARMVSTFADEGILEIDGISLSAETSDINLAGSKYLRQALDGRKLTVFDGQILYSDESAAGTVLYFPLRSSRGVNGVLVLATQHTLEVPQLQEFLEPIVVTGGSLIDGLHNEAKRREAQNSLAQMKRRLKLLCEVSAERESASEEQVLNTLRVLSESFEAQQVAFIDHSLGRATTVFPDRFPNGADEGTASRESLSRRVFESGEPLVIEEIATSEGEYSSTLSASGIEAYVGFPVEAHGERVGVLSLYSGQRRFDDGFSESDREFFELAVIQVARVIEHSKSQAKIAEAISELERSNRELDSFAYVASHDLKAPLRAIQNLAQWVIEDSAETLSENSKSDLELLQSRVRRMERLLNDLLEYSRVGRAAQRQVSLDLKKLVEDVIALQGVPDKFELVIDCPTVAVCAPRAALEKIIRNLLGNAVKHHTRESGRLEVVARVDEEKRQLVLAVSDDGPGIPEHEQERIFQMFTTLKPRDEVEGSGMGLAMVQKTAEFYGGKVTVDSEPGKGSTFTVYIALTEEACHDG